MLQSRDQLEQSIAPFGARPMARLVEKTIKKPLSDLLLFGDVKDGDRVVVDLADDSIQVKRE